MPAGIVRSPIRGAFGKEVMLFGVQTQRRRGFFQKLLFGALLRFPQETGGLFAGTEKFQIHCFIVRRGAHPLC